MNILGQDYIQPFFFSVDHVTTHHAAAYVHVFSLYFVHVYICKICLEPRSYVWCMYIQYVLLIKYCVCIQEVFIVLCYKILTLIFAYSGC